MRPKRRLKNTARGSLHPGICYTKLYVLIVIHVSNSKLCYTYLELNFESLCSSLIFLANSLVMQKIY